MTRIFSDKDEINSSENNQKGSEMKKMFMSRTELQDVLPWSKNIVSKMIKEGVFIPVKNPVGSSHSKQFFWRPQVEEAVSAMVNTRFQAERKG